MKEDTTQRAVPQAESERELREKASKESGATDSDAKSAKQPQQSSSKEAK